MATTNRKKIPIYVVGGGIFLCLISLCAVGIFNPEEQSSAPQVRGVATSAPSVEMQQTTVSITESPETTATPTAASSTPTPINTPVIASATPKPTQKPTAKPTAKPTSKPLGCKYTCSRQAEDINCSDFKTHNEAQTYFSCCGFSATNDPMDLDGRGHSVDDGIACENLP